MKVILCLHHFLPDFTGGTEIYVLRLAQHLKTIDINPIILIPNFDRNETEEYSYDGIRVIKYAEASLEDRQMIMGKKSPDGLAEFGRILKTEKPCLVHFQELAPGRGINIYHVKKAKSLRLPIFLTFHLSYYSCFQGSLIFKNRRKCDGVINMGKCTACAYQSKNIGGPKAALMSKVALSLHRLGIDATRMNNRLGTALGFPFVINKIKTDLMQLSELAEKIIVIAEWYKEILIKNKVPASKLVAITQGLTGNFVNINHDKSIALPLKLVFLGRISALKGLDLLIDAVNQLPEDLITLHIYGQETDADFAAECRVKTASKRNIQWKGKIGSEKVLNMLTAYDLLCLPSTFSEMSPLVIQEAFAAGLPILASDVFGNAEQIKDGTNGWLFKYKSSEDLTAKLKMISNDLSLLAKAKQNLPSSQSFGSIAENYAAVYHSVLHTQRGRL